MDFSPLITIAIASYNNAQYIERCVDTVIGQSYSNLEILIIDDASKDDTHDRIKKYAVDKRVRIILKENGGLSSVRQLALEEATGDYICFIDADDYLDERYVEKHLSNLLETGADISVCSTRFETADGIYLKSESKSFECALTNTPIKTTVLLLSREYNSVKRRLLLSDSWNKMYRLDSIKNTGVRFCMPKGLNGSDFLFNHLLVLHELSYAVIPYTGYIHVIYSSSAVHRKNKDLKKTFEVITDLMLKECDMLGITEELNTSISRDYNNYQLTADKDTYESRESLKHFLTVVNADYYRYLDFIKKKGLNEVKASEYPIMKRIFYCRRSKYE